VEGLGGCPAATSSSWNASTAMPPSHGPNAVMTGLFWSTCVVEGGDEGHGMDCQLVLQQCMEWKLRRPMPMHHAMRCDALHHARFAAPRTLRCTTHAALHHACCDALRCDALRCTTRCAAMPTLRGDPPLQVQVQTPSCSLLRAATKSTQCRVAGPNTVGGPHTVLQGHPRSIRTVIYEIYLS
jgi:hypothetical protein